MYNIDWFAYFYDIIIYLVGFRSLIDEVLYKLHFKRHLDFRRDLPCDLSGQVAIVTGGTRGLGLTVVKVLLSKGCNVVVASSQARDRHSHLVQKVYEGIPEIDPESKVLRGIVSLQHLDLSSLNSVRSFVTTFNQSKSNLNYLVCNAGIMFAPRQLTEDNVESHLAVNYLGHCLLILELLPHLKRAADGTKHSSRIINVSSSTHRVTKIRFDDLLGEANYSRSQAYGQSKLAQIMFTAKLSRFIKNELEWKNVQCFSLHPGVVLSELYEHVYLIKYFPFLVPLFKLVTRDMVQGAETTLYAALSPELEGISGSYLEDNAIKAPSQAANDIDEQERLWEVTKGLLNPWISSEGLLHHRQARELI